LPQQARHLIGCTTGRIRHYETNRAIRIGSVPRLNRVSHMTMQSRQAQTWPAAGGNPMHDGVRAVGKTTAHARNQKVPATPIRIENAEIGSLLLLQKPAASSRSISGYQA
jgi:hypothetical protein